MAFPGTGKIWMNGTLVDWKDAKIHVASHVVHYGSAVFEGARCYETPRGPACFRLDAHMRRLFDSARIYRMEPSGRGTGTVVSRCLCSTMMRRLSAWISAHSCASR